MTPEERTLLARLFEAYALAQPEGLEPSAHFRATYDAAQEAGIIDVSRYLYPGPHGWDGTR